MDKLTSDHQHGKVVIYDKTGGHHKTFSNCIFKMFEGWLIVRDANDALVYNLAGWSFEIEADETND